MKKREVLLISTVDSLRPTIPNTVSVNFDTDQNIPKIYIDQAMIQKIVITLIENAIEAIGDDQGNISLSTGEISIEKSYISKSNFEHNLYPGKFIYFEISDNGIGMDQEEYERIFDPFYSTKFIGRGLGLAVVLGILRAHNGAIQGTSEKGKGSSFKILLPAVNHDKAVN